MIFYEIILHIFKYHTFKIHYLVRKVLVYKHIGCKNLQILSIFGELIAHLHVCNIHLEKSGLDNSMVQPSATKKVRVLLIFGKMIGNLFNEFQGKKFMNFAEFLSIAL